LLQAILEKFEFFPIKCRVQRSLDVFKMAQLNRNEDGSFRTKSFKIKVIDCRHSLACCLHEYSICDNCLSKSFILDLDITARL
jgi:hypothetical protein